MPPEHATVADLLGIALITEPAHYEFGCEPADCPAPRPTRPRARCLERKKIAPFYEAVLAGAPDADVARASGLTLSQVRGWRLRLGIKRKPGATAEAKLRGALLTTPELAHALRAMGRVEEGESPAPIRISYEELAPFLREHHFGSGQSEYRERPPGFARRATT